MAGRIRAELAKLDRLEQALMTKERWGEGPREALVILRDRWSFLSASLVLKEKDAEKPEEIAADVLLRELNQAVAACHAAVADIARITIPPRLNGWLEKAPAGYHIPFHAVFEDELRRKEDRDRLLEAIALVPKEVPNGLVDARVGVVYRHSGKGWQARWLSIAGLVLATCLVGLALFFGEIRTGWLWLVPDNWKIPLDFRSGGVEAPAGRPDYFVPWIAILLGIAAHAVVAVHKRGRESGAPPMFALGVVPEWIETRMGTLIQKGLLSLVALVGIFTVAPGEATAPTAFLVGYSLDSFVGIFETGVGQRADAKAHLWKERIAGEKKAG